MTFHVDQHSDREVRMKSCAPSGTPQMFPIALTEPQDFQSPPKLSKTNQLQSFDRVQLNDSTSVDLPPISSKAKSSKANNIEAVESIIQYKFMNRDLLWEALHSRGVNTGLPGTIVHADGNLRLAFVGDAVLKLCLAEDWYTDGVKDRGHFNIHFAQGVGRNSNLNKAGLALGLERFINGGGNVPEGKGVADTVEAILGAVYLDAGKDKAKHVMDALGLLPRERLLERELRAEGLVMMEPADFVEANSKGKKRRKSDAS